MSVKKSLQVSRSGNNQSNEPLRSLRSRALLRRAIHGGYTRMLYTGGKKRPTHRLCSVILPAVCLPAAHKAKLIGSRSPQRLPPIVGPLLLLFSFGALRPRSADPTPAAHTQTFDAGWGRLLMPRPAGRVTTQPASSAPPLPSALFAQADAHCLNALLRSRPLLTRPPWLPAAAALRLAMRVVGMGASWVAPTTPPCMFDLVDDSYAAMFSRCSIEEVLERSLIGLSYVPFLELTSFAKKAVK